MKTAYAVRKSIVMDFYLKIAGLPFYVSGWRMRLPRSVADYLSEPDLDAIPVEITEECRAYERKAAGKKISPGFCELLCAVDQIVPASLLRGRMFIHGAGIAYRNRGFLFTAPSGTGKTTHVRLWRRCLGDDVQIINGDKPVLTFGETITMSGSPWSGKERYQSNRTVPLEALILLKRGAENAIRPVDPQEALEFLYHQIFFIDHENYAMPILGYLDQLLRNIPVYELYCTMEEDAVRCSFEGLTKLDYANHKPKGRIR